MAPSAAGTGQLRGIFFPMFFQLNQIKSVRLHRELHVLHAGESLTRIDILLTVIEETEIRLEDDTTLARGAGSSVTSLP